LERLVEIQMQPTSRRKMRIPMIVMRAIVMMATSRSGHEENLQEHRGQERVMAPVGAASQWAMAGERVARILAHRRPQLVHWMYYNDIDLRGQRDGDLKIQMKIKMEMKMKMVVL